MRQKNDRYFFFYIFSRRWQHSNYHYTQPRVIILLLASGKKVVLVMATKIRGSQVTLSWPDKFRIAGSATHYFSHILAALEKSHWL